MAETTAVIIAIGLVVMYATGKAVEYILDRKQKTLKWRWK